MVWCFDYNFKNGVVDQYVADITTVLDSAKCYFETYPYKVQNIYWLVPILKSLEFYKNELLLIHNRYYYPLGVTMKACDFTSNVSRFGFNGQACPLFLRKKDDEVKGEGNSLDYGAIIYDYRLGRWLSCDPLASEHEWLSPYNYCQNSPNLRVDPSGEIDELVDTGTEKQEGKDELQKSTTMKLEMNARGLIALLLKKSIPPAYLNDKKKNFVYDFSHDNATLPIDLTDEHLKIIVLKYNMYLQIKRELEITGLEQYFRLPF